MNAYEKIRGALEEIKTTSQDARNEMSTANYPIAEIGIGALNDVVYMAESALDAPPRNCDVGTPKERLERFRGFCQDKEACTKCFGNKTLGLEVECFATWEDMPYDENKKGEDNANEPYEDDCRESESCCRGVRSGQA